MRRVERLEKAGNWPADAARDTLMLAYEDRHRRRGLLRSQGGEELLLDLPRAVLLEDGDGLLLSDGAWAAVRAAPESLIEIQAASPGLLCRFAWHLGNRHLPAQIEGARILIRPDHVIEAMLARLGARLQRVHEPFRPEGGAYAAGGASHAHEPH
jgi:urease accessory protein